MAPYIRRVVSLEALKQQGTDEQFFRGQDYAEAPSFACEALDPWCRRNAANMSLPSRGATTDEPHEIYYIALGTKNGRNESKAMMQALVPILLDTAKETMLELTRNNFLSPNTNKIFDNLAAIVTFRDTLVRFGVKPSKSSAGDPAVVIGGV